MSILACNGNVRHATPPYHWDAASLAVQLARGGKRMPQDIYEIRRKNLRHLRGPDRGGQGLMAKKLNMSESQLSQVIGKTPSKSIGSRLARRIEREYRLPEGWLDAANHDLTEDAATFARRYQALDRGQQKALRDLLASFKK